MKTQKTSDNISTDRPRSFFTSSSRLPVEQDFVDGRITKLRRDHLDGSIPDLHDSDSPTENSEKQHRKVKTRIRSWSIKSKANFKKDSPVVLLGNVYSLNVNDLEISSSWDDLRDARQGKVAFREDFHSRFWFTYRRDFPKIANFSTDCGWGCMLRSGQMLLAQALSMHLLGRHWRYTGALNPRQSEAMHRQIVRWFADCLSHQSPLSIHRLSQLGQFAGKRPGEWYGPASVAHLLREALKSGSRFNALLNQLRIYVAQDCTGASSLNQSYIDSIQKLLTHHSCIGIIGGKPKHSLYFVGWQDDELIYLDPHYCQDYVDLFRIGRHPSLDSFHCSTPRKLSFSDMDPSCTIGFYCANKNHLQQLSSEVPKISSPNGKSSRYPLFVFSEEANPNHGENLQYHEIERSLQFVDINYGSGLKSRSCSSLEEDFEFL